MEQKGSKEKAPHRDERGSSRMKKYPLTVAHRGTTAIGFSRQSRLSFRHVGCVRVRFLLVLSLRASPSKPPGRPPASCGCMRSSTTASASSPASTASQALQPPRSDDEECKEALEAYGWNNAEVDRGDGIRMVAQESPPTLRWRSSAFDHVPGDRRLRDFEAKLEQFAVDARSTPLILPHQVNPHGWDIRERQRPA